VYINFKSIVNPELCVEAMAKPVTWLIQQRRHKSCREKLEEATFDILHEMHDENTTLTDLKKKYSRALEIIKCLHCELSITQREYEILHEAILS